MVSAGDLLLGLVEDEAVLEVHLFLVVGEDRVFEDVQVLLLSLWRLVREEAVEFCFEFRGCDVSKGLAQLFHLGLGLL